MVLLQTTVLLVLFLQHLIHVLVILQAVLTLIQAILVHVQVEVVILIQKNTVVVVQQQPIHVDPVKVHPITVLADLAQQLIIKVLAIAQMVHSIHKQVVGHQTIAQELH